MAVFLSRRRFKMAVSTLTFIAATAAALLASLGAAEAQASNQVNCALGEKKKDFSITKPGGTLQVTCLQKGGSSGSTKSAPQICADDTCSKADPTRLQLACPGGQQTPKAQSGLLDITCPQLPNTTTSILILCGTPGTEDPQELCAVELTVSAPPPEGPQVCAAPGTTVTLAIHGEGAQTQFACATGNKLTTLNPPQTNKVYKEDCTAEEDLKDLKLTTGDPYHTLAATKKPRSRKLCYVCKAGAGKARTGEEQCKILIDVSAGTGRFKRSALGLALCYALALLRLI